MIELINVSKSFNKRMIFQELNVAFSSGKKIYIRGVNGSGKSVLLKMIVGYSRPDKGMIKVDGIQIGKDRDFIPNAGVSINAPEFIKSLSGMENLLELANIRKVAKKEDILKLADYLDLQDDLKKKYSTYSLGMKQKLRIIQAVMEKPQYLILDEPFDALDKESKEKVSRLLDDFITSSSDRCLIYTSHDSKMDDFADEVYEIDDYDLVKVEK